jgi:RNA polymerase primary sigma factor
MIDDGRFITDYRRVIEKHPLLSRLEECRLGKRKKTPANRQKLILSNLRLVFAEAQKIARLLPRRSLSFQDLIQEGIIGLIKAVERYDYRRKNRFASYAVWWIRQIIVLAIYRTNFLQKLPVYTRLKLREYGFIFETQQAQSGQKPKEEEMEQMLGITKEYAALLRRLYFAGDIKLISPICDDDYDYVRPLQDKRTPMPPDFCEQQDIQNKIKEALKILDPRAADVIKRRFGLNGGKPESLQKIGEDWGISREYVRQIQVDALRKLQYYLS